jgi:hypothetical protein
MTKREIFLIAHRRSSIVLQQNTADLECQSGVGVSRISKQNESAQPFSRDAQGFVQILRYVPVLISC